MLPQLFEAGQVLSVEINVLLKGLQVSQGCVGFVISAAKWNQLGEYLRPGT